jgi:hypothetical protein
MEVEQMMADKLNVQAGNLQRDGVCFFCGSYADLIEMHETKVHGMNRSRQNEGY